MTNSEQPKKKRTYALEMDKRIFAAKYFDGYETQSVPKKHGKGWHTVRVYVGDAYEPLGGKARLRAIKLRYSGLIVAFLGLMLFGGSRRSSINNSALAVLPYAVALVAGCFALTGIARLVFTRDRMTKYSYARYCREVNYGASTACAGALVSAIASLFLLIRDGWLSEAGVATNDLIPVVSYALCAAMAYAIHRLYQRAQFAEIKGREPFESPEE